jgi:hypothetical protein
MAFHHAFAAVLDRTQAAITYGMLGVAAFVAFRILTKRTWVATLAAIVCYTPVVLNGMFPGETPILDVATAIVMATIFFGVVAWIGLLATIATLMAHLILIGAPLTTDLSSWRGRPVSSSLAQSSPPECSDVTSPLARRNLRRRAQLDPLCLLVLPAPSSFLRRPHSVRDV